MHFLSTCTWPTKLMKLSTYIQFWDTFTLFGYFHFLQHHTSTPRHLRGKYYFFFLRHSFRLAILQITVFFSHPICPQTKAHLSSNLVILNLVSSIFFSNKPIDQMFLECWESCPTFFYRKLSWIYWKIQKTSEVMPLQDYLMGPYIRKNTWSIAFGW